MAYLNGKKILSIVKAEGGGTNTLTLLEVTNLDDTTLTYDSVEYVRVYSGTQGTRFTQDEGSKIKKLKITINASKIGMGSSTFELNNITNYVGTITTPAFFAKDEIPSSYSYNPSSNVLTNMGDPLYVIVHYDYDINMLSILFSNVGVIANMLPYVSMLSMKVEAEATD